MIIEQKNVARFTTEEKECLSKLASVDCQNLDDVFCNDCPFDLKGRCVKADIRIICQNNNIKFT